MLFITNSIRIWENLRSAGEALEKARAWLHDAVKPTEEAPQDPASASSFGTGGTSGDGCIAPSGAGPGNSMLAMGAVNAPTNPASPGAMGARGAAPSSWASPPAWGESTLPENSSSFPDSFAKELYGEGLLPRTLPETMPSPASNGANDTIPSPPPEHVPEGEARGAGDATPSEPEPDMSDTLKRAEDAARKALEKAHKDYPTVTTFAVFAGTITYLNVRNAVDILPVIDNQTKNQIAVGCVAAGALAMIATAAVVLAPVGI